MSSLVSGEAYVAAINQTSADRECRAAFQSLVLRLAGQGGAVFDFGCGPGLDARHYAEQGLRVGAYDIDPDMRTYFSRHCADQIANGTVQQNSGSYEDFLRDPTPRGGVSVDLIAANFAPLNLVPEPARLFEKFAGMLKPRGVVLLSVLDPLYPGDLRYAWWWRNVPRLLWRGEYSVAGTQAPITRYLPRRLARLAAPHFELDSARDDASWSRANASRFQCLLFRVRDPLP